DAWTPELAARDAFLRSLAATRPSTQIAQRQDARVVSAYTNRLGQPCRVVEQDVWIGGESVKASGTVCEQPNGVWAVMK
ncbi:MAG TPA: hypothetical protein VJO12_15135, partial [Stellaceae bacterium]|nr:hypothetical protein [Stellaceae bacterium]